MKPRFLPLLLLCLALPVIGAWSTGPETAGGGAGLVPADPIGTLGGVFSVDGSGAATYQIDLEIPPGTADLTPELSLTYNGQRDNGTIGMGWALNGIESVARCNANQVPNGYTAAVSYNYQDRFCLAGMPLLAISGDYGEDGTVYRTVRDTWTRIVSHGTCGQGPCWFSADNKDGAQLRFGFTTGTTGSRILATGRTDGAVRVWSQDRYTDLNGNYAAITYANNAVFGEYYPARIDYTGNDVAGLAPQRSVAFEYQSRSDRITGYSGGSPWQILSRLSGIKTYVGAALVKHYALGYDTSPITQRSRVTSIQDCSSDVPSAATCLPASRFESSSPANGFTGGSATSTGLSTSTLLGLMPMDVNGDGKTDFVAAGKSGSKLQLTTYLSIGRALGPGSTQTTGTDAGGLGELAMDVNGDRQGDVVMPVDRSGKLSLYAFLSNGTGFGGGLETTTGQSAKTLSFLPQDVDADGREDVVQLIDQGGKVGFVVYPSTGSGTFGPANTSSTTIAKDNLGFFPLDVNGDGRVDVVQGQKSGGVVQFVYYLSDGRAFGQGVAVSTGRNPTKLEIQPADVNGDGLGDLLLIDLDGSTAEVTPFLSTGTSFKNVRPTTLSGGTDNLGVWSTNLNGDDRADLLQLWKSGSTVRFLPFYGNGESFTAGTPYNSSLATESLGLKLLDLDGDGKQDALDPQDASGKLKLTSVLNTVGQPDLLTRGVNGLGGEVTVVHKPMTDNSIYTKGRTATYPVVDLQTSMPLVASYTNTDGRGGSYTFAYAYDQGRVGYTGYGWLGFRAIKMTQVSDGRFSEVLYGQDWPANGLISRTGVYNVNGVALSITDLSYQDIASATLRAKGIHQFVRTAESYSAFADNHGGARLYTLKKTYEYDAYGNLSLVSDLGQPGVTANARFTCFRYDNDPTTWRLGYVTQELLASSTLRCQTFLAASNPQWDPATDITWSKKEYDTRKNLTLAGQWDDSNNVWVAATSLYDQYGNVLTTTDPAGNTTTFEFDPTYHTFLARMTSPPNEAGLQLIDTFGYEPYFGNQIQNLDSNGNLFTWTVDALGRVVDEYGPVPGGSSTQPVRLRHTSFASDSLGTYTVVSSKPTWSANDDPTTWFWEKTYTDGLEREWRTETRGDTTGKSRVEEIRFNAEGQASQTSLPYFANETPSWIVTAYDVYNRPTTVTQPDGTVQKLDYSQLGALKVYTTDAYGTPEARTEIDQFTPFGQLASQSFPNGQIYRYQYNLMGELVQIDTVPERRQVTFTYDSLGRLRSTASADIGTTQYHWDPVNRMTGSTDAAGNTIVYGYDKLGRAITVTGTTAAGTNTLRLTYDGPTANGRGNVTRAELNHPTLGAYDYQIGYDPYKQTRAVAVSLGGKSWSYGMDYTPLGQVAGETYPDGAQLTVAYRPDANPSTFSLAPAGGAAETYLTYAGYDANDVPLTTTYKNGVETTRAFYPNDVATGKLKSITAKKSTATLFANQYTWNRIDFVTKVDDLAATRGNQVYTYDPAKMGFLTTAQGPYGNEGYDYDRVGNRTSHNGIDYTYPTGSDRLSSFGPGTNMTWNANGTLETLTNASGTFRFGYDAGGRVVGVNKDGAGSPGVMAYDFAGNRIYYQPIASNQKFYGISADFEIADYGNGKVTATKYLDGQYGRAVAITGPATQAPAAQAHALAARLYRNGHGPRAAGLAFGHGLLAVLSAPGVIQAVSVGLLVLLFALVAYGTVFVARRRRPTRYARHQPLFARIVPVVAALFLLTTAVPVEAALTPGSNGPGNPTDGTLYFVQDLVQSTVSVTDANGQSTAAVGYLPFGDVDPAASQGVDNFRPKFTDKTFDYDSQLYFFGQRFYDPEVGRFTTPDPAAQYLNPYVLGADNPISQIDPTGEFAFLAVIIIGAIVGAYMGAAAVNHDYNPANWDWKSGKTYAGLLGGAIIGAVGGVLVEVAATAGVAAGIAGAVLVGAGENAAFTAMGGGSAKEILISAAEGAAFGFLFGAAGAAAGRFLRGAGRATEGASGAGRAARAGAELVSEGGEAAESAVARGLKSTCSSFLPGETVLTADGSGKAIETMAVGDQVLGYQASTDHSGIFPVAATLTGETTTVTRVTLASGETIEATPNHPFRVQGMGWIAAEQLSADFSLVDPEGRPVAMAAVETRTLPAAQAVFNVSVGTAENYYVGSAHVLVKNILAACAAAKLKRRPGFRKAVKDQVFSRQTLKHGVGKGQIRSAVSAQRYARSYRVAVGSKGRKVTIWQLDHADAPYRDLLWAATKSKKVITWKNLIEISNYAPNLRYLTMAENVSHAFEPTTTAGRAAAIKVLQALGYWK